VVETRTKLLSAGQVKDFEREGKMTWFQRYGIPGAYFEILLLAWLAVIYPSESSAILHEYGAQFVVGIVLVSFLPIGYLIYICQNLVYLNMTKPRLGITGRAMREAGIFKEESIPEHENMCEAEGCLFETSESNTDGKVRNANENEQPLIGRRLTNMKKQEFLQNWIRNRNDLLSLNFSLIIANLILFLIVMAIMVSTLFVEGGLPILILLLFMLLVTIILGWSWKNHSDEIVRVEAGTFLDAGNKPAYQLQVRVSSQENQANQANQE